MTSQELDQHSKIPTTKEKVYIIIKSQRQKALSFFRGAVVERWFWPASFRCPALDLRLTADHLRG